PGLASSDDGSARWPSVGDPSPITEDTSVVIEPLLSSASRKRTTRRVDIGGVVIGGDAVPVIAGPCAVEAEYVAHADAAARAGASALRGCVLKPRTHAHSFQGLGALGLRLLDEARERTGLPIVAEPLG